MPACPFQSIVVSQFGCWFFLTARRVCGLRPFRIFFSLVAMHVGAAGRVKALGKKQNTHINSLSLSLLSKTETHSSLCPSPKTQLLLIYSPLVHDHRRPKKTHPLTRCLPTCHLSSNTHRHAQHHTHKTHSYTHTKQRSISSWQCPPPSQWTPLLVCSPPPAHRALQKKRRRRRREPSCCPHQRS